MVATNIIRSALVLGLMLGPAGLAAQGGPRVGGRSEIFVGSELENYLRFLQTTGSVPPYPWSIRGFSPRELDRLMPGDSGHPWAHRYALRAGEPGRWSVDLVRPTATAIVNTGFPFGFNDGPIWAGRGVTTALEAGVAARYGPVSLTLAPMVFTAQNASFPLFPNGQPGKLAFGDVHPFSIDHPQRFGDAAYSVVDPGQSTLRVDLPVVTAGVSTANQQWGPAGDYPIILGNNAAGYPHGFVGTSAPLDLWLMKVHVRAEWGVLQQSAFSSVTGRAGRRFMSGIVALLTPRGVPGLELGAGRFFHTPWPAGGLTWANFRKPFETFLKAGLPYNPAFPSDTNQDVENQLASVFFRWVLPASGFEVYGEYGREDHSWDLRDAILEPDHSGGYMIGFRKMWPRSTGSFLGLRGELLALQVSQLVQGRGEGPFYLHESTRQGHTERGQILGADDGEGGAASILAIDQYRHDGRWTVAWTRAVRGDLGAYWQTGVQNPRPLDVRHTLGVERLWFLGRFDVAARINAVYELNRNFVADAFNLNVVFRVRGDVPRLGR